MTSLHLYTAVKATLLVISCLQGSRAMAQAFLYPGVQSSTEAGLSQTNTRGATAVITNPANIIVTPYAQTIQDRKTKRRTGGIEAYADLSLAALTYTYTRSGYGPATVSVVAPPVTLGAAWRPKPQFAFGLEIVPRPALTTQNIANLPFDQQGDISIVNATSKQGTIITGIGFAAKPSRFLSFGFSLVETAESNSFVASDAETDPGGTPLVQMRYSGSFMQVLAGTRMTPNADTLLGVSYKTGVVKKYKGELSLSGAPSETTTKQGYLPAVLSLGGEFRFGLPVLFAELRHEFWQAGAGSTRSGLPGGASSTALQDTNIMIVGARQRWQGGHAATVAFGKYPPNVQLGSTLNSDGTSGAEAVDGVQFGEFENLDRNVFAGGYRHNLRRGYLQGGLNIQMGSRLVSEGYRNAGTYKMSVFTFSGGVGGFF